MPRSRALRNVIHNKLRQALAFYLNHVLVNHVAGLEMGVLVQTFIIEALECIRVLVQREIERLLIEEEEGFEVDSSSSEDEPVEP